MAASQGERCLYVSLADTRDELTTIANAFGWPLGAIEIVEAAGRRHQGDHAYCIWDDSGRDAADVASRILNEVERTYASRVVIDSLAELKVLSDCDALYEARVAEVVEELARRKCTSLVLDEVSFDKRKRVQGLANCVLSFGRAMNADGSLRQWLRVASHRLAGTEGCHQVNIGAEGIEIIPDASKRENFPTGLTGMYQRCFAWYHSVTKDSSALTNGQSNQLFGTWNKMGHVSLVAAVKSLCQSVRDLGAMDVKLDLSPDWNALDEMVSLVAFRIVRKSLRYTTQHVKAKVAFVSVSLVDDQLVARMSLDPTADDDWTDGLCGDSGSMADLISALGGSLICESSRDGARKEFVAAIPLSRFPDVQLDSFRFLEA